MNIDGGGAGEIAEALKVNTSLTSLHLDDNNIGDQGARSLAEARKSNISLTSLYLDNYDIVEATLNTTIEQQDLEELKYNQLISAIKKK
ncbi:hypothetical protein RAS_06080 [Rickettsia asiatica]|uniref:Uncharacterized protein n=1 Tax=Rickettsia asiatica TaxID=238800 RepID=A0A510GC30_9RICK|nr:hypothetical protein [Rickettsia asiatica]BBJ31499.1 hypothetical protein RAS_06080 [Rickettsia asiatica]